MTVADLGRRLSSSELTQWMAYSLVEPFGQPRVDEIARLQAMIAINIGGAKPPIRESELLMVWEPAPPVIDEDTLAAKVESFFGRYDRLGGE